MSTFDGCIKEFPDIQVDFFYRSAHSRPPLACFLSHVHTDHLVGLDTLRSPFVYCSAATKAMLLRLERSPCRIHFNKGILEAGKRTYRKLGSLLKPLPLESPTVMELAPGKRIQVTLLEANHCPGSVMFLFENAQRAVLYTGDTRCEPWFVNALVRNPCLLEYTSGLRHLDTVYLDTSFIQRGLPFQTKADGLRELLHKVSGYPSDTVFHLQAWTFGYEDVWRALSKALQSKVHIGRYKMRLYRSLLGQDAGESLRAPPGAPHPLVPEAPALVGFLCANARHPGCLVTDDENDRTVRIHSCDKETDYCPVVRNGPVVWIRPVVCHRPDGQGDMIEAGAQAGGGGSGGGCPSRNGGGHGFRPGPQQEPLSHGEASVTLPRIDSTPALHSLVAQSVHNRRSMPLSLGPDMAPGKREHAEKSEGERLAKGPIAVMGEQDPTAVMGEQGPTAVMGEQGPTAVMGELEAHTQPRPAGSAHRNTAASVIAFPYSRHSSYDEQCHLLSVLRPRDVWPCTFRQDVWLQNGVRQTIKGLFGEYCSGNVFRHDKKAAALATTDLSSVPLVGSQGPSSQATTVSGEPEPEPVSDFGPVHPTPPSRPINAYYDYPFFYQKDSYVVENIPSRLLRNDSSQDSSQPDNAGETRLQAYQAAVRNAASNGEHVHIKLSSTSNYPPKGKTHAQPL